MSSSRSTRSRHRSSSCTAKTIPRSRPRTPPPSSRISASTTRPSSTSPTPANSTASPNPATASTPGRRNAPSSSTTSTPATARIPTPPTTPSSAAPTSRPTPTTKRFRCKQKRSPRSSQGRAFVFTQHLPLLILQRHREVRQRPIRILILQEHLLRPLLPHHPRRHHHAGVVPLGDVHMEALDRSTPVARRRPVLGKPLQRVVILLRMLLPVRIVVPHPIRLGVIACSTVVRNTFTRCSTGRFEKNHPCPVKKPAT